MENLDLTSLSQEQRDKIMEIVNQGQKNNSNVIREEYLSGLKNIRKSEDYEGIELDTKSSFDNVFTGSNFNLTADSITNRKIKGKLTQADKVTYQQLETIHESGSPANFWNKVKNVLESKVDIKISDVDDKIDPNILK